MAKKSVKEIAAEQAAKEAARVLATAAKLAAKSAMDVPFSASLEHRLTLIEAGQTAGATTLSTQHATLMSAVLKLEGQVGVQNGRVAKLESWRTQVTAIYGGILVAAPFVFFALQKWFGG